MSGRNLRSLIAIAVLVALWFSFRAWTAHKEHEEARQAAAKPSAKILPLKSANIRSFTITPRSGEAFTCSREGKAWAIVKPQGVMADQGKISSFLQSLTGASVDQVISNHPSNLNGFGLAPPEETILATSNATPLQFTLRIGDETPTSSGVYAQVAGDSRVFTLTDDMKTALEKSLFELRDTRAVTLDTSQINGIQVTSGKRSYTLAKNPEGVWEVSLPPDVRADHFAAEGLVDDLQSLSMQSIVEEAKKSLAPYSFGKPTLTVRLSAPAGIQTLTVGGKTKQGDAYYAENSALNPVFTLDESSVTQFQKNASDFRDKNLFSWDMFDVKSFVVTSPDGDWIFEQQNSNWKETSPDNKTASSDDVNAFLSVLRDLQASSFPSAKPGEMDKFGFAKASYVFKVTFGAKNQTQEVDVAQANGKIYARRPSDPLPSEISQSDLTSIENAFAKISAQPAAKKPAKSK
jgi:hypothetical protein